MSANEGKCRHGLPTKRFIHVDNAGLERLQKEKILEADNAILRDLLERAIIGGAGWKADAKAWLGGKHRKPAR